MGIISDRFASQNYRVEAEVNLRFVIPILTEFLGYSEATEIVPEHMYPAKDLYSGSKKLNITSKDLKHRPDFIICRENDLDKPLFILEAKGADEDIREHLPQIRSYAQSLECNLIAITNGIAFDIY